MAELSFISDFSSRFSGEWLISASSTTAFESSILDETEEDEDGEDELNSTMEAEKKNESEVSAANQNVDQADESDDQIIVQTVAAKVESQPDEIFEGLNSENEQQKIPLDQEKLFGSSEEIKARDVLNGSSGSYTTVSTVAEGPDLNEVDESVLEEFSRDPKNEDLQSGQQDILPDDNEDDQIETEIFMQQLVNGSLQDAVKDNAESSKQFRSSSLSPLPRISSYNSMTSNRNEEETLSKLETAPWEDETSHISDASHIEMRPEKLITGNELKFDLTEDLRETSKESVQLENSTDDFQTASSGSDNENFEAVVDVIDDEIGGSEIPHEENIEVEDVAGVESRPRDMNLNISLNRSISGDKKFSDHVYSHVNKEDKPPRYPQHVKRPSTGISETLADTPRSGISFMSNASSNMDHQPKTTDQLENDFSNILYSVQGQVQNATMTDSESRPSEENEISATNANDLENENETAEIMNQSQEMLSFDEFLKESATTPKFMYEKSKTRSMTEVSKPETSVEAEKTNLQRPQSLFTIPGDTDDNSLGSSSRFDSVPEKLFEHCDDKSKHKKKKKWYSFLKPKKKKKSDLNIVQDTRSLGGESLSRSETQASSNPFQSLDRNRMNRIDRDIETELPNLTSTEHNETQNTPETNMQDLDDDPPSADLIVALDIDQGRSIIETFGSADQTNLEFGEVSELVEALSLDSSVEIDENEPLRGQVTNSSDILVPTITVTPDDTREEIEIDLDEVEDFIESEMKEAEMATDSSDSDEDDEDEQSENGEENVKTSRLSTENDIEIKETDADEYLDKNEQNDKSIADDVKINEKDVENIEKPHENDVQFAEEPEMIDEVKNNSDVQTVPEDLDETRKENKPLESKPTDPADDYETNKNTVDNDLSSNESDNSWTTSEINSEFEQPQVEPQTIKQAQIVTASDISLGTQTDSERQRFEKDEFDSENGDLNRTLEVEIEPQDKLIIIATKDAEKVESISYDDAKNRAELSRSPSNTSAGISEINTLSQAPMDLISELNDSKNSKQSDKNSQDGSPKNQSSKISVKVGDQDDDDVDNEETDVDENSWASQHEKISVLENSQGQNSFIDVNEISRASEKSWDNINLRSGHLNPEEAQTKAALEVSETSGSEFEDTDDPNKETAYVDMSGKMTPPSLETNLEDKRIEDVVQIETLNNIESTPQILDTKLGLHELEKQDENKDNSVIDNANVSNGSKGSQNHLKNNLIELSQDHNGSGQAENHEASEKHDSNVSLEQVICKTDTDFNTDYDNDAKPNEKEKSYYGSSSESLNTPHNQSDVIVDTLASVETSRLSEQEGVNQVEESAKSEDNRLVADRPGDHKSSEKGAVDLNAEIHSSDQLNFEPHLGDDFEGRDGNEEITHTSLEPDQVSRSSSEAEAGANFDMFDDSDRIPDEDFRKDSSPYINMNERMAPPSLERSVENTIQTLDEQAKNREKIDEAKSGEKIDEAKSGEEIDEPRSGDQIEDELKSEPDIVQPEKDDKLQILPDIQFNQSSDILINDFNDLRATPNDSVTECYVDEKEDAKKEASHFLLSVKSGLTPGVSPGSTSRKSFLPSLLEPPSKDDSLDTDFEFSDSSEDENKEKNSMKENSTLEKSELSSEALKQGQQIDSQFNQLEGPVSKVDEEKVSHSATRNSTLESDALKISQTSVNFNPTYTDVPVTATPVNTPTEIRPTLVASQSSFPGRSSGVMVAPEKVFKRKASPSPMRKDDKEDKSNSKKSKSKKKQIPESDLTLTLDDSFFEKPKPSLEIEEAPLPPPVDPPSWESSPGVAEREPKLNPFVAPRRTDPLVAELKKYHSDHGMSISSTESESEFKRSIEEANPKSFLVEAEINFDNVQQDQDNKLNSQPEVHFDLRESKEGLLNSDSNNPEINLTSDSNIEKQIPELDLESSNFDNNDQENFRFTQSVENGANFEATTPQEVIRMSSVSAYPGEDTLFNPGLKKYANTEFLNNSGNLNEILNDGAKSEMSEDVSRDEISITDEKEQQNSSLAEAEFASETISDSENDHSTTVFDSSVDEKDFTKIKAGRASTLIESDSENEPFKSKDGKHFSEKDENDINVDNKILDKTLEDESLKESEPNSYVTTDFDSKDLSEAFKKTTEINLEISKHDSRNETIDESDLEIELKTDQVASHTENRDEKLKQIQDKEPSFEKINYEVFKISNSIDEISLEDLSGDQKTSENRSENEELADPVSEEGFHVTSRVLKKDCRRKLDRQSTGDSEVNDGLSEDEKSSIDKDTSLVNTELNDSIDKTVNESDFDVESKSKLNAEVDIDMLNVSDEDNENQKYFKKIEFQPFGSNESSKSESQNSSKLETGENCLHEPVDENNLVDEDSFEAVLRSKIDVDLSFHEKEKEKTSDEQISPEMNELKNDTSQVRSVVENDFEVESKQPALESKIEKLDDFEFFGNENFRRIVFVPHDVSFSSDDQYCGSKEGKDKRDLIDFAENSEKEFFPDAVEESSVQVTVRGKLQPDFKNPELQKLNTNDSIDSNRGSGHNVKDDNEYELENDTLEDKRSTAHEEKLVLESELNRSIEKSINESDFELESKMRLNAEVSLDMLSASNENTKNQKPFNKIEFQPFSSNENSRTNSQNSSKIESDENPPQEPANGKILVDEDSFEPVFRSKMDADLNFHKSDADKSTDEVNSSQVSEVNESENDLSHVRGVVESDFEVETKKPALESKTEKLDDLEFFGSENFRRIVFVPHDVSLSSDDQYHGSKEDKGKSDLNDSSENVDNQFLPESVDENLIEARTRVKLEPDLEKSDIEKSLEDSSINTSQDGHDESNNGNSQLNLDSEQEQIKQSDKFDHEPIDRESAEAEDQAETILSKIELNDFEDTQAPEIKQVEKFGAVHQEFRKPSEPKVDGTGNPSSVLGNYGSTTQPSVSIFNVPERRSEVLVGPEKVFRRRPSPIGKGKHDKNKHHHEESDLTFTLENSRIEEEFPGAAVQLETPKNEIENGNLDIETEFSRTNEHSDVISTTEANKNQQTDIGRMIETPEDAPNVESSQPLFVDPLIAELKRYQSEHVLVVADDSLEENLADIPEAKFQNEKSDNGVNISQLELFESKLHDTPKNDSSNLMGIEVSDMSTKQEGENFAESLETKTVLSADLDNSASEYITTDFDTNDALDDSKGNPLDKTDEQLGEFAEGIDSSSNLKEKHVDLSFTIPNANSENLHEDGWTKIIDERRKSDAIYVSFAPVDGSEFESREVIESDFELEAKKDQVLSTEIDLSVIASAIQDHEPFEKINFQPFDDLYCYDSDNASNANNLSHNHGNKFEDDLSFANEDPFEVSLRTRIDAVDSKPIKFSNSATADRRYSLLKMSQMSSLDDDYSTESGEKFLFVVPGQNNPNNDQTSSNFANKMKDGFEEGISNYEIAAIVENVSDSEEINIDEINLARLQSRSNNGSPNDGDLMMHDFEIVKDDNEIDLRSTSFASDVSDSEYSITSLSDFENILATQKPEDADESREGTPDIAWHAALRKLNSDPNAPLKAEMEPRAENRVLPTYYGSESLTTPINEAEAVLSLSSDSAPRQSYTSVTTVQDETKDGDENKELKKDESDTTLIVSESLTEEDQKATNDVSSPTFSFVHFGLISVSMSTRLALNVFHA